jgi:large subunit ribosomal protein L30
MRLLKKGMKKQKKSKGFNKVKTITIKWKRSVIGRPEDQRKTIKALGFKRLNQILILPDRPEIRGMMIHVNHLLEVMK